MAATMAGAFKAWLESLGLGLQVFRDGAPMKSVADPERSGQTKLVVAVDPPYLVVQEGIGLTPSAHGDTGAVDAHLGVVEQVQLDLVQVSRQAVDALAKVREDYDLADAITVALDRAAQGLQLHAPWRVYGVRIETAQRWPVADNRTRHTWTVRVSRDARRAA